MYSQTTNIYEKINGKWQKVEQDKDLVTNEYVKSYTLYNVIRFFNKIGSKQILQNQGNKILQTSISPNGLHKIVTTFKLEE